MKLTPRSNAHERGFTIVEVMVAIIVLLVGVLGAVTLLNTANATTALNQNRNGATNLVRDIIEAARAVPYNEASPTVNSSGSPDGALVTALQTMQPTSGGSSFADSSPQAGWQITRRGTEYTITLRACVVDDPKDGSASSHTPANSDGSGYYCPKLATSASSDSNPDDYRRVSVQASWSSASCNACTTSGGAGSARTFSVSESAIIINPTGGLGPAPVGPPGGSNGPCPPQSGQSWTYTATFDNSATGAVFTVNDPGATTFTATVPSSTTATTKTYTFTYNPSPLPPDNTYELDMQAFNAAGQFGRVLVTSIYVNCHQPSDPTGVAGGFDWRRCTVYPAPCGPGQRIFDIDWNPPPASDGDIVGYYVWRVNGVEDWKNYPTPQPGDTPDTLVSCQQRGTSPPTTTTMPGFQDFLEPFQPACWDASPAAQQLLPSVILDPVTLNGAEGKYWIQAVDPDPNNASALRSASSNPRLTDHSDTIDVTENMLNVRPTSPVLSLTNVNGVPCLSWTDSTDVLGDGTAIVNPVKYYRIYRDANPVALVTLSNGAQVRDVPYLDRIGRASPNAGNSCDTTNPTRSWYSDSTATGHSWNYWVTAVDNQYLESYPSNGVTWSGG